MRCTVFIVRPTVLRHLRPTVPLFEHVVPAQGALSPLGRGQRAGSETEANRNNPNREKTAPDSKTQQKSEKPKKNTAPVEPAPRAVQSPPVT